MKISAETIMVQMKDREGNVETKVFSKGKPKSKVTREFEEAEIIDMNYGAGKRIDALRIEYWDGEDETRKLVNEVFPLEYVLVHIKGRKW